MPRGEQKTFPTINNGSLEWVFVNRNKEQDLARLRTRYRYNAIDLQDVLPPLQRPKVVERNGYLFLILLYPQYDPATRDVRVTEVDFFISKARLVTINVDGYQPLLRMFSSCRTHPATHVCMSGDITRLLCSILERMTADVFHMIVQAGNELDAIEQRIFQDYEKDVIGNLLRIKTNIATIRRAMQGHERAVHDLVHAAPAYFPADDLHTCFDRLTHDLQEIWDSLDIQKETADALHDTTRSLIDFRINEIIKTLTIFSVIILPLSAMAGIFGMNVPNMPIVTHGQGFWIIGGMMLGVTGGMLGYFKWKRWI